MGKIEIPFYYINLEKNIERRESMEEQLKKYVEKYYRVEALDGNKFLNQNFSIDNFNYSFSKNSKNFKARGCLLSHFKIFRIILKKKIKTTVICEDDLSFELIDLWDTNFTNILEKAPGDWDIIKLNTSSMRTLKYCSEQKNKKYINNKEIEKNVFKGCNSSTLCYIIKYKAVEKIFGKLFSNEKLIFDENQEKIDNFLWDLVNTYNYNKPLFKSKESLENNKVGIVANNIINNLYYNN
jgi:GR25 family glycosyltransferase involved in LPS biosynthesis